MRRREFLRALAAAAACGAPLAAARAQAAAALYDVPRYGNASFLHFTDCHAQLLPAHFREPSANLGVGEAAGRTPSPSSTSSARPGATARSAASRTWRRWSSA